MGWTVIHSKDGKKHTLSYDCQCGACSGTGLYVGFGEHDGAAIQCHSCDGTGKTTGKTVWRDFDGRGERGDVVRVLQHNPGIGIGAEAEKNLKLEHFGGMSYEDWADGKPFPRGSEMRAFCCPAWWYQSVDYDKKPRWDECLGCGMFSGCKHFEDKARCWARWDNEHKEATQ